MTTFVLSSPIICYLSTPLVFLVATFYRFELLLSTESRLLSQYSAFRCIFSRKLMILSLTYEKDWMSRLVPFKGWRQGGRRRAAYFILAGPTQIQPQIQTPVMRLLLTVTQHRDTATRGPIHSPWLGEKVDYGIRLPCRPVRLHIGWRVSATTLCHSQLYPPSKGQWIWLYRNSSLYTLHCTRGCSNCHNLWEAIQFQTC